MCNRRSFLFRSAAVTTALVTPFFATLANASSAPNEIYNIAEVRSHQFVETWTSLREDGQLQIRAHVANGKPWLGTSFAPIVTLAFHDVSGAKIGELVLHFNVGAIKKDEWHTIVRPGGNLWYRTAQIKASAAENLGARPTRGSWSVPPGGDGNELR